MYTLRAEAHFDSAHFLKGYVGKCSNIHGHRWRIVAEIRSDSLIESGEKRGMVVDFGDLKSDLKAIADELDHCLIYETGSLSEKLVCALKEEGFRLIEFPFRPTAECFARYIFDKMADIGYNMKSLTVYETPDNCAVYGEEL